MRFFISSVSPCAADTPRDDARALPLLLKDAPFRCRYAYLKICFRYFRSRRRSAGAAFRFLLFRCATPPPRLCRESFTPDFRFISMICAMFRHF